MSLDDPAAIKFAKEVIHTLGEKSKLAKGQIYRLVEHGGIEFVEDLMRDTLQIEEEGGLMTLDGSRRRTIGGVFFHLAKQRVPQEYKKIIFYYHKKKKKKKKKKAEQSQKS